MTLPLDHFIHYFGHYAGLTGNLLCPRSQPKIIFYIGEGSQSLPPIRGHLSMFYSTIETAFFLSWLLAIL